MPRHFLLTALGVALIAVVAHGPGLGGGFVYDDHRFIELNPALASFDLPSFFSDPSTASASGGIQHDVYRPLRTLLFAAEWHAFGDWASGWHAVSILLHALASVLVLRLLVPLVGRSLLLAGTGAALFAVHPVAVETVAWLSSQGDLLAFDLGVASLIVLERRGRWRTLLGVGLGVAACLAKESAIVLPALLLLRDVAMPASERLSRRLVTLRTAAMFVAVLGYLAVRFTVIPDLAQVPGFAGGSREAAARGMLAGLVWYAQALFTPSGFPFDVHLLVPLRWTDPEVVLGFGLLLTLLATGLWGLLRRRPLLTFATWGALACLVPVSNVLVPLKALVAERFLYPVLLCVAAGVVYGFSRLTPRVRGVAAVVFAILLAVLVPITWQRTRAWADDLVLWETVLKERPSHMRAYEGLGYEYRRRGRIRDAEIAYRSYLEYNPIDAKTMRLLGDVFGETAEALRPARVSSSEALSRTGLRRARMAQLEMYGQALATWERVGLVRGRGSDRMVIETWDRVAEAAWDLGDLAKVKRANDALLALEGVDPADPAAVFERGSFHRRRLRVDMAWRAATTPMPRDLAREEYERRMAERAQVLADAGIAPNESDREALGRVVAAYDALVAEMRAGGAPDADLEVILALRAADAVERMGRRADAQRRLEAVRARHPSHPLLGARR